MTKLAYSVKEAAEVVGCGADTIKAAIHSTDPKRKLRAKALTLTSTGRASKFTILHADLVAWLEGLNEA